jgi:hypothetical protein
MHKEINIWNTLQFSIDGNPIGRFEIWGYSRLSPFTAQQSSILIRWSVVRLGNNNSALVMIQRGAMPMTLSRI